MFVDHGCDAIAASIMPCVLARVTQCGPGYNVLLTSATTILPFYYISLTEYFIGHLKLPALVGPDDASLAYAFVCCVTAMYGFEIWLTSVDFGLGPRPFVDYGLYLVFTLEVSVSLYSAWTSLYEGRKSQRFQTLKTRGLFWQQCSFVLVLLAVHSAYAVLTEAKATFECPWLVQLSIGFQFL